MAAAVVAASAVPSIAAISLVVPGGSPAPINATVDDDGNIVFPARPWRPNNAWGGNPPGTFAGVTLAFETTPFIHATKNSLRRDCRLTLTPVTQTWEWSIVTASDQTDYQAGDQTARVVARSNFLNTGAVRYDLTATFLTGEYDQLAEGTYAAVVTVTLAAN